MRVGNIVTKFLVALMFCCHEETEINGRLPIIITNGKEHKAHNINTKLISFAKREDHGKSASIKKLLKPATFPKKMIGRWCDLSLEHINWDKHHAKQPTIYKQIERTA